MLTVQVGPPAEILPWPFPSGVVAGTPYIRVDEASGAVIRGDSKHRWPAWPHPVFGLEPWPHPVFGLESSSVRSTRSESERDSQPERKSTHAAITPPDDAASALEASVIQVAVSARKT